MYDILTAIYYGELSVLKGKRPLEQPYSIAESRIQRRLRVMAHKTAKEFKRDIRALAIGRENAAFRSGVRFGAQLAIQLLDDF